MEPIVICDKSTPKGHNACFNLIASLLLPLADRIVVSKAEKNTSKKKWFGRGDDSDSEGEGEDEDRVVKTTEFLQALERDNIGCKIFTNKEVFEHELGNIKTITGIYRDDFGTFTTFYEYDECIGFTIQFTPVAVATGYKFKIGAYTTTTEIHVLLQYRCEPITKHSDFVELARHIQPVLDALHSAGYLHLDIKPDNIVYCDRRYKLIDYGNMQYLPRFIEKENTAFMNIKNMVTSGRKLYGGRSRRRNTRKLRRIVKKRKTQCKK